MRWSQVGHVGIAVAILAAWWFGRGPSIVTQVSGTTLLSAPNNGHIKVLYDDRPVGIVTQSIVWIWREGRGTVRGADAVPTDQISITVPEDAEILDVSLLVQSVDTNNVQVTQDPLNRARAILTFDYLDQRQGAVIEVMHTAQNSSDVTVSGTIMGIPSGIKPVRSGLKVALPVGISGSVDVTIPTHSIPRRLRIFNPQSTSESIFSGGLESAAEAIVRLTIGLIGK